MDAHTSIDETKTSQSVAAKGQSRSRLSPRASLWAGVAIWVAGIAFSAAGILLLDLNQATLSANPDIQLYPGWLTSGLPYVILGGLIVARRPANRIGWVLSAAGLAGVISFAAQHYAIYALATQPAGQPLAPEAAWLAGWLWIPWITLVPLFILLYPDGNPPSPRWRWAAWLDLAVVAVLCLPTIVGSWSVRSEYIFNGSVVPSWVSDSFNATFPPLLLTCMIISLVAAVFRYRAAQSVERAQIRWVIYAAALAIAISLLADTLLADTPLRDDPTALLSSTTLSFLILPVCIGVAIFRYHLFDIDRLINRTLVYVPLTGILAGVYAACVGLLQRLFQAVTGEKSDAAIVLTTLILTALFTPIKNSLQAIVDRRWKEPSGSLKKLKALGKQVEESFSPVDPAKVVRRLFKEAALALGAKSGAAYLQRDGQMQLVQTYGDWQEEDDCLTVSLDSAGEQLGLIKFGDRGEETGYTEKERKAVQEAADVVATAIAI
jgi:hypothetical protein